jgi:hypothetical protein
MLNGQTYTPNPEAEATTAILPLLPAHLRRQVLAEQARLLEMARSIEKAKASDLVRSHYHSDNQRNLFRLRSAWQS